MPREPDPAVFTTFDLAYAGTMAAGWGVFVGFLVASLIGMN